MRLTDRASPATWEHREHLLAEAARRQSDGGRGAVHFFDETKETVPTVVPCTLDETCASDDPSCITCQRDLAELETLLNLNERVDWAVFLLLVLAAK